MLEITSAVPTTEWGFRVTESCFLSSVEMSESDLEASSSHFETADAQQSN